MSDYRVAVRYAKSLLGLAEERGKLDELKADFKSFRNICESNRDFVNFLKNPIIPHLKKWAVLKVIFKDRMSKESFMFLEIVTKKNREFVLPEIAKTFLDLCLEKEGIVQAKITTAIPMDQGLKDEFNQILKDIVGKDKKLEIDEQVDEDIIGGYQLLVGDKLLDSSISSRLKDLKKKLVI